MTTRNQTTKINDMKKLTQILQILKEFEQEKIGADCAESRVLSLFNNNAIPQDIRDEMDADMEDGSMPQGEIESCLNHWNNRYIIIRKVLIGENQLSANDNKKS